MAGRGIRTDIQALRALAVGLVVVDHADLGPFHGGYVGVDVFFVVSGFLITALLLREVERTGRVSIADFYARRARRILPAATVVLVATMAWAAWALPSSRVHEVAGDVGWAGIFLANVHFASIGTDYFAAERAISPVQHFWSLAVEEQFYLVWPALILLVLLVTRGRPQGRRLLVLLVGLAWVGSLLWSLHLTGSEPTAAYFSPFTRTYELATGALLAFGVARFGRVPAELRTPLALSGLVLVAWGALSFDTATAFPGATALVPVLGTAALLVAGTEAPDGRVWRAAAWRPLQWLGDRSYSLYLWHWPVLILGREDLPYGGVAGSLTLVLVAVGLSELSYRYVETPLRDPDFHLLRHRKALVMWPSAVVLIAASCWASVAYADHRLSEQQADARDFYADRISEREGEPAPPVRSVLRTALADADDEAPIPPLGNLDALGRDVWQTGFRCYASWDPTSVELCPLGDRKSRRTMVVYGDSHAGMWLPSLAGVGKRAGYRVVPLVKVGCAPFDVAQRHGQAAYPACDEFRSWALDLIEELEPDLVVLASRGLWAVEPGAGKSPEQAWRTGAERTLARLADLAPRTLVLSGMTAVDTHPQECLTAPESTMATCTRPFQDVTLRANEETRAAAEAQGASYVDVTPLVCLDGRCPMAADFLAVFRDNAHITASWGRRVSRELGVLLGLEQPALPHAG